MQTPPLSPSGSLRDLSVYTPPSVVKNGLMALPNELLHLIIYNTGEVNAPLKLLATAKQFKDVYTAHERQYYMIVYNMDRPEMHQALTAKSHDKARVPDPNTPEWLQLKKRFFTITFLTTEERRIALIKKAYIQTWDLLLQPEILAKKQWASALIKILLDLLPHISNAEEYAAKLFSPTLPQDKLRQLTDAHLDRGLQLIVRHFPLSQIRSFIAANQLALIDQKDVLEGVKCGRYPSFLFYSIAHFEPKYSKEQHALVMHFVKNADTHDVNARDKQGYYPLDYAIKDNGLFIIQVLLQHPRIDVNAKDPYGFRFSQEGPSDSYDHHFLHWAIDHTKSEDLSIVEALFTHPSIFSETRLNAFKYVVWQGKNNIASLFWQHMNDKEKGWYAISETI